jgi:hypothetical protein
MAQKSPHKALMTPEILHNIFGNFKFSAIDPERPATRYRRLHRRTSDTGSVSTSTLLNAALSCKNFLEPALDALWWRVTDVRCLFRILPSLKRSGKTYVSAYR